MHKIDAVDIQTALPEEKIKQNCLDASKYNLEPISLLPSWREGRSIALVGGGPSLSNYLGELYKYQTVIACGSVHDYLVNNGVIVDYCVVCDPDPITAEYLKLHHESITYLLASQCDKSVFNLLRERTCYLWHSSGGEEFNKIFTDKENIIPGGCTVGTRAILTAIGMGYKNIDLYGFDSCITDNRHHAYNFIDETRESLGNISEISLDGPDKPKFQVAGYMMAQIFDFQKILDTYAGKLNINVYGGGPLAEILKIGKLKAEQQKDI